MKELRGGHCWWFVAGGTRRGWADAVAARPFGSAANQS
jgi:hypothetical protein